MNDPPIDMAAEPTSSRPRRRRLWVVLGLTTLVTASALSVATVSLASSRDDEHASAEPESYCDATLRALQYTGDDSTRFHALLEPVQATAPAEVAATIGTLRRYEPGSPRFEVARKSWDYYNNNHCCRCLEGQYVPTIEEYERSQSQ